MSFSKISTLAAALAIASKVAAHGTVTGIVADGVYYEGYSANFQYMSSQPVVVGWSTPEDTDNGFVAPDAYTDANIICHKGATNAQTSATVAAGGTVELQWTVWPSSHHGPVIDYLANCGGDCKTVDKTTLEFFKIDGVGLIDDTTIPGNWASDILIANNNSWTVTIPGDIEPGNYVLRHEIIALHSAGTVDGAQNYPQCVNLEVTGTGTATPAGVLGTALYTETDPGIEINIYQSLSTYIVPGPTLYSGAVGASQTGAVSTTATAATSAEASSVVASPSTVITSAASSAVSSAAGAATAIASPSGPSTGSPHYSNSTATSSKKTKSACKSKSKTTSLPTLATSSIAVAAAASVTLPTTSHGFIVSSSSAEFVATSTVVVSPVATTTSSAPTPSEITEPEGTTLGDLLSWLSSFYTKHAGTSYTDSTIAHRHPRALRV